MDKKEYLQAHLQECFQVIDTCLASYYAGETHMYRPLAGQMRMLWCDFNRGKEISLLPTLHPEIRINKLQSITWSQKKYETVWIRQPENGITRLAGMPYEIIKYSNGLVIAEFLHAETEEMLNIPTWLNQPVCFTPTPLTAKEIVKHVADKGGGVHVEKNASYKLRCMYQKVPTGTGHTYAELFILALARLTQEIGENILGYEGCKIPFELRNDKHERYRSLMLAHVELAEALNCKNRAKD